MATNYTYNQLVDAIRKVGISQGDIVLVHSSLFSLGRMEGVTLKEIPVYIFRAFCEVLGSAGTLAVPTTFEDYARLGKPYDCRHSPVDPLLGVFSQYVADLDDSFRTYCPLLSVAAYGPLAKEICHLWTASACGTDSAWEKLYHYDSKLCYLGIRPSQAFTFARFIQFRFGVPYIYNKIFTTPVYEDSKEIFLTVTCPVRYLNPEYSISENSVTFEEHLWGNGLIECESVGKGRIYNMKSAKIIFEEGTRKLKENVYYFLKQKPNFVSGQIPMDGNIGKYIPDHIRFAKETISQYD